MRGLILALAALNAFAAAALGGLASTAGATAAGLGVMAWLLGLRHAFDADHIAAIDNVTRRLRQRQQRPVAVGLFFSLGHSTVVFALTVALLFGMHRADGFAGWLGHWGLPASLLGSALFLTTLGVLNARALHARRHRDSVLFDRVASSRAMFPLGLLFGLNLDTAAEIMLLAVSASAAQHAGLPAWAMLSYPLLFTAGMAAADTAEGLLMLRLYDWALSDHDRTLRLNTLTTGLSVALALGIATLQWIAFARWAGIRLPELDFQGPALGIAATAVMTALWLAARWRRAPAVAGPRWPGCPDRV